MPKAKKVYLRPAIIVTLAAGTLLLLSTLFPQVEWRFYDYRCQLVKGLYANALPAAERVVVIGIDGVSSLREKPLIFWYPQLAEAIQQASGEGAAAIGIDIIPYHSLGEKLDAAISESTGESSAEVSSAGHQLDRSLISALLRSSASTPILQGYNGDIVPFYYGIMAHMPGVIPVSLLIEYDKGGVLRRAYSADDDGSPRLLTAACQAVGSTLSSKEFLVDFRMIDNIPTIDLMSFVKGKTDPALIRDRIVLIGLINGNEDSVQTPIGLRNGIFFQAAAIETALKRSHPTLIDPWVSVLLLTLLCLIGQQLAEAARPRAASLYILALSAVYFAIDMLFFSRGVVIPAFPHLFAIGFTAACTYPYRYLVEERDRIRLMETFSYYVDRAVIENLVGSDPGHLMKGEQRQVTVLALDIRNFTGLSNEFPAETVVALLNLLFGRITEVVQTNNGFVNKFIGDGLLAFFPGEESPAFALDSALQVATITREMNTAGEFAPLVGTWPIHIGIGLHYGTVIMGNVGSHKKMDFTVIGPAVNLAFRVESATKGLGETILVTRPVFEATRQTHQLRPLGEVSLKGFSEPVAVYAPTDEGAPPLEKDYQ